MKLCTLAATALAALMTAACSGDKGGNPIAPTPDPPTAAAVRSVEILGLPETPFVPGDEVTLTASVSETSDATTQVVIQAAAAIWSSSDPAVAMFTSTAMFQEQPVLKALQIGNTTITARVGDTVGTLPVEISPLNRLPVDEEYWAELLFDNHDCKSKKSCPPLVDRMLRRLPVTSPNILIYQRNISPEFEASLRRTVVRAAEQITGHPYHGEISTDPSRYGPNWIAIESIHEGEAAQRCTRLEHYISGGSTAAAAVGAVRGCIVLNASTDWGTGTAHWESALLHEMGHAMGLRHTSDQRDVMWSLLDPLRSKTHFRPRARRHAQFAYTQPRGATYSEIMLGSASGYAARGSHRHNMRPIIIVD